MTGLLVLTLGATPAWTLTYQRADGTGCPDQAAFTRQVAERLGAEPFSPAGEGALTVRFSLAASGPVADLEVKPPSPAPVSRRHLEAQTRTCDELARSVALSVAMVIDPLVLTRPAPSPTPAPAPTPAPTPKDDGLEVKAPPTRTVVTSRIAETPSLSPPATTPPPSASSPSAWRPPLTPRPRETFAWQVSANGSLFATPGLATLWTVEALWETGNMALGLRGAWTTSGSLVWSTGSVKAANVTGGPIACWRTTGPLGACVVANLGVQQNGAEGLAGATWSNTVLASVGAQPFLQLDLGSFRVRLQAGVQAQPTIAILKVGTQEVWRNSYLSFWFGLGFGTGAPRPLDRHEETW